VGSHARDRGPQRWIPRDDTGEKPKQEPFWLRALDAVGGAIYPAVIGGGSVAVAQNIRNYNNLLSIASRVAPVSEEMLELTVPMLGGEE